jgi:small ligand-binding sensory domain FIST
MRSDRPITPRLRGGSLTMTVRCASALSTLEQTEAACEQALDRLSESLEGTGADLALAFVSEHHAEALGHLSKEIRGRGLGRAVLGCTGESIIGDDREVEGSPAIALWAARMPGVEPRPIRMVFDGANIQGWPEPGAGSPPGGGLTVLLGDPFTFPADDWLRQHNAEGSPLRVVGGMASAGRQPGRNRLVLDDEVYEDGAVAVHLDGPIRLRTIVSQGCKPIGRPMIVTKADRNLIKELGQRPAIERLREVFDELTPEDQQRVREGLHVGRVINEYQESFHRGDFLVRNVVGADDAGGIAIGDIVRVGQTVQFHVRDAESADEDLRALLADAEGEGAAAPPAGALLFSCNGRGSRLFSGPHHDVGALREIVGPIPVAGFFAMGEIGPVGGQNFLHGFTASIALFEAEVQP